MRKLNLACALLLLLSVMGGCAETLAPEDTVSEYLRRFERQDFGRMYSLLSASSKADVSLNDFCDRYEDIYKALHTGSVTCAADAVKVQDESHQSADFSVTIQSDRLGTVAFAMTLPLEKEGRRWGVEWCAGLILPGMTDGDTAQMIQLPAVRGEIFDSSGNVLARNDHAPTVYVNPDKVDDPEALVRLLAPVLMISEADLRKKLPSLFDSADGTAADDSASQEGEAESVSETRPVPLKAYTKDELTTELEAFLLDLPGVGIEDSLFTPIRSYPYGQMLSHLLGYTGPVTAEELEADPGMIIPSDGLVGKSGLEKKYNNEMTGAPGWELFIVNESGQRISLARKDAVNGRDLRLSINIGLQKEAELQLMEHLTADMAGSVIVLDPDTGFVQAIASYPAFDPNAFTLGISEELWEQYNDADNNLPLFDRTSQGLYPPGSTLKPFTAAIALMSGAVSSDYVFRGVIQNNLWTPEIPGWVYPAIKRFSATPSPLNMRNAMVYSDNIYFADIAMRTGSENFYAYCQRLGMDRAVPSDIPVAAARISNTGEIVTIKDLADSGYGQGQILITPLQMATLFASLSNGGTIYSPLVVRSMCVSRDFSYETVMEASPSPWITGAVDGDALDLIEPLLRLVVSQGTARSINVEGLDVHGKTGTAQIGEEKDREIAWIIGYTGEICESTGTRRLVTVTLEIPAGTQDARGEIAKALLGK